MKKTRLQEGLSEEDMTPKLRPEGWEESSIGETWKGTAGGRFCKHSSPSSGLGEEAAVLGREWCSMGLDVARRLQVRSLIQTVC